MNEIIGKMSEVNQWIYRFEQYTKINHCKKANI